MRSTSHLVPPNAYLPVAVRLTCLVAASLLASGAQADQGDQQVPDSNTARVEIIGIAPLPGIGIERDLLPYPVQLVKSKELRKAGGDNLAELMTRNLTGVSVNEVSGSPFQNDVTFRGFRASPVLGSAQGISVYLDGVRINEAFGDVVNWDMLPEAAIGSLLLVPGANPLYGLNTLGGALAFTTRSGISHPGGEIGLSFSNRGRRRADLGHGWRGEGGWHSFVGATWFDDAGWRDHSNGRLGNLLLKIGRSQGDTDWSLALLGGRSRLRGNGLLPDGLYQDDRRSVYTHPDTSRNRLGQGTLNLTHRLDGDSEVTATAYLRNSRRDTINGDISEDYADYVEDCGDGFDAAECGFTPAEGAALHPGVMNTTSTRQQGRGLSAALSTRRGAHRFDAGISLDYSRSAYDQYEQEAFIEPTREVIGDPDEEREPDAAVTGSSRALGVYVAASHALSPVTQLTASARLNRARVDNTLSNERGVQPAESFTYTRLNPSLGFTHQFNRATTVFANIAQGNRVPTVIELGCADPDNPCRLPVGLQADPYLKQVVARTLEAGVRGQYAGGRYAFSLHRTGNRDDILFLSAPSRQGYFANVERTRHQGLDASFTQQFGRLDVRLAYSYLQAQYDADEELFTGARTVQVQRGTRLAGLPRHSGKLALDWKASALTDLGLDLQAASSLVTQGNEDGLVEDPEEGATPERADWRVRGHVLVSLRASYRPAPAWELFARVNNLFDRRYETFGAVAPDLFPGGRLLQPHAGAAHAAPARFVAPGAPRAIVAGLRYIF